MSAKILPFKRPEPKPFTEKKYPVAPNPGTVTPLKRCPFCGHPPKYVEKQKVSTSSTDTAAYIVCTNEDCSVMTPYFYTINNTGYQEAIEKWNRRV